LGNPKDVGYRIFRSLTRHRAFGFLLKTIPQSLLFKVSSSASQMSRKYRAPVPSKEARIREIYRQSAETIFKRGYDIVIMGHTHLPDDVTLSVEGRPCRYINTGDWVRHFTYLEFDGQEIYTRAHPLKEI
jgi:UDP-2,3-diacylglucosamine hydrolase